MSENPRPSRPPDVFLGVAQRASPPDHYTMHVGAVLGDSWIEWFEGALLCDLQDGTGLIIAKVRDHSEILHKGIGMYPAGRYLSV